MTPGQAIAALESGRAALSRGRPLPPQEWPESRREALRANVDLAIEYLRGKRVEVLARRLGSSRQNVYERVTAGVRFLEQRGHLHLTPGTTGGKLNP